MTKRMPLIAQGVATDDKNDALNKARKSFRDWTNVDYMCIRGKSVSRV